MLSIPHLVVIFIVALIVLGPDKLPEVARALGRAMAEFRRITGDFRAQVEGELQDLERQARLREDIKVHEADIASCLKQAEEMATAAFDQATAPVTESGPLAAQPPAEEPLASSAPAPSEKPSDGESHPT